MCKCSLTYQTGMDMPASSSRLAIITTCPFFQSRIQRKQVVCEHWNHSRLILPRICALLSILAPKKKKKLKQYRSTGLFCRHPAILVSHAHVLTFSKAVMRWLAPSLAPLEGGSRVPKNILHVKEVPARQQSSQMAHLAWRNSGTVLEYLTVPETTLELAAQVQLK